MRVKPGIAIVGAGNFGRAMAAFLRNAGYAVELVKKPSSQNAAARMKLRGTIVWFCVPDREIARAAKAWADTIDWKGRVALHSSGALTSDELDVLRRQGAAVASVHPLMTFVRGSRPSLKGVSFAVEGDAVALRASRRIVKDLGGKPYSIRKEDKSAYHAWGTFASPLLTALLATTEQVAAQAGVDPRVARRRALPILRQTLANYAALGADAGFSGPIIRGDVDTITRHLQVLKRHSEMQEVYLALARAAVRYLPGNKKRSVLRALNRNQT
jgi:predicted short-subunit dehydrogenase-like oxidoreductase (DUF2520 family)